MPRRIKLKIAIFLNILVIKEKFEIMPRRIKL